MLNFADNPLTIEMGIILMKCEPVAGSWRLEWGFVERRTVLLGFFLEGLCHFSQRGTAETHKVYI